MWKMRIAVACAALLVANLPPGQAGGARKPNIVVIVADDLGYADLGCHGCKDIPTPQIDALAKNGVRCTHGYVASPVGGPTRAALLTGRYPQRFGHEFNPPRDAKADHGLPLTETTLANHLQEAGYATALIGKWHLGEAAKYHPRQRGFGEFFGFLGGARYYQKPNVVALGAGTTLWPNGMMRGRERAEEKEYVTDAFAREAVGFLDRQRKGPFFLMLSYNAPHTSLEASDKYLERVYGVTGGDHRRRVYAAMITALDDGVGAVTAKLKELGQDKDTLVFFLSDNGGITGYLSPSSNAPLQGAKGEVLEGGIRVPFLVKWPGRVPSGGVYEQPVSVLDVAPTALAAARKEPPKALDGVDLLPYLAGKKAEAPHERLCWRYGPNQAIREGQYKLIRLGKEPPQLFDLQSGLGETRDLAKENPEVVKRLTEALKKWDGELKAPAWGKYNAPPWW